MTMMAAVAGVAAGSVARASTPPPYEPDPQSVGGITFYDSVGAVITRGNLADVPFAVYAVGDASPRAGDVQAILEGAQPQPGIATTAFATEFVSAATNYPIGTPDPAGNTPPHNVAVLSGTHPVLTGQPSDESLAVLAQHLPNDAQHQSDPAYQNVYQIRLLTKTRLGALSDTYDVADLLVDTATGTWTQVFPPVGDPTTTILIVSANPVSAGQTVTLTATESPTLPGSIQFMDGFATLGPPIAVDNTGTASYSTSFDTPFLISVTARLTAVFTPDDVPAHTASTSNEIDELVKPPAVATRTSLIVLGGARAGDRTEMAAFVSAGLFSLGVTAGTVAFYDNDSPTPIPGTVVANPDATYHLVLSNGLSEGPHSIVARFTPTNPMDYLASESLPYAFVTQPGSGSPAGTETVNVNIPQIDGAFTVTVDQTPVSLGTAQPNGAVLEATGQLSPVTVNDGRIVSKPGWRASGQVSDFTRDTNPPIDGNSLGWTPTITTPNPANDVTAGLAVAAGSNPGLRQGAGLANAGAGQGLGPSVLGAGLDLRVPPSTNPGAYSATLTITVIDTAS